MKINKMAGSFRADVLTGALLCVLLIGPATRAQSTPLLQNGDFETGNLSGWTVFVTSNGDLGSGWGLPDVVSFDVAGTGTPSDAAEFQVGEASYNSATGHTSQGGGIYQSFNCSTGLYIISAEVAAFQTSSYVNSEAGLFTLMMDGTTIANVDFGQISPGQTLRSTLDVPEFLSQGSHQITLEITRPWLNSTATPLEYVDNIQVEPVPEPSGILVGLLGLSSILILRKSRTR